MTPSTVCFLLLAAVATIALVCIAVALAITPKEREAAPAAPQPVANGPHLVIVGSRAINMDNVALIDCREPDNVLISAGHELLDFHGQDARDIAAYFKIPTMNPAPHKHGPGLTK